MEEGPSSKYATMESKQKAQWDEEATGDEMELIFCWLRRGERKRRIRVAGGERGRREERGGCGRPARRHYEEDRLALFFA